MQKLCVLGLGYVGVVTAACFARLGHIVIGVDNNPQRVELLSQGHLPFFEPGLDELLKEGLGKGTLSFSTDIDHAIKESKIIFICVGTPADENGRADMGQVEEVSRRIAKNLNEYKLIVEKSTVPAGTARRIEQAIRMVNINSSPAFDMASNPEFLREGSAVRDFLSPDRVILGVESRRAAELARELYRDFDCPILITDIVTAELIKHASNAFLAMKISFANLMADICEKVGADISLLADGMGYDRRIGREFLNAGAGYGGSCFPKDVKAFAAMAGNLGVDINLLKEIDRINEGRISSIVRKLEDALWVCQNKRIAVLGLAFKCNTDDVRESPGIKLIKRLTGMASKVVCYDPRAMDNAKNELTALGIQVSFVETPYAAAIKADALVLMTEWPEIIQLDFKKIRSTMRTPVIVDGRNMLDAKKVRKLGFLYYGIGLGSSKKEDFFTAEQNSIAPPDWANVGMRGCASKAHR